MHSVSQRGLREAYTETALKVDRQSAAAFVDVYRLLRRQYFPLHHSWPSRTDLILEDSPPPPFRSFPFYQFQFVFDMDKQDCSWPDVRRYTSEIIPSNRPHGISQEIFLSSFFSSDFKIRECLSAYPGNFQSVWKCFLRRNGPRKSASTVRRSISDKRINVYLSSTICSIC